MRRMHPTVIAIVMLSLVLPAAAPAQQTDAAVRAAWRAVAERAGPGADVTVELADGTRVRAVLIGATEEEVLLKPKTRIPVPVQAVRYDVIASLEPARKGMGTAKAAIIGVASGVAAFWAVVGIAVAIWSD